MASGLWTMKSCLAFDLQCLRVTKPCALTVVTTWNAKGCDVGRFSPQLSFQTPTSVLSYVHPARIFNLNLTH